MADALPRRIQRKRTSGWRMPEGAIYVGRPARYGNPASIGTWVSAGPQWRQARRCTVTTVIRTPADAVRYYRWGIDHGGLVIRDHLGVMVAVPLPSVVQIRADLAGHDLACWCPLYSPCHADVLLDIANT